MPARTFRVLLLAVLLISCSSPQRAADSPSDVAPSTDVVGDGDSVWEFLSGKYDGNADGTITAAEYTRDEASFQRLDRNEDGALSIDDFTAGDDSPARNPAMMAAMIAMRAFQADDDEDLARSEMEQSLRRLDADGDGMLTRDELEAEPARGMLARMDRFAALQMAADEDDDEQLSRDELLAWFDERDSDGDGNWSMGGARRAGRGNRRDGPPAARPLAAAGNVAPDFTLEPLHDGAPVTLSSFAGKTPVALIFGSYT